MKIYAFLLIVIDSNSTLSIFSLPTDVKSTIPILLIACLITYWLIATAPYREQRATVRKIQSIQEYEKHLRSIRRSDGPQLLTTEDEISFYYLDPITFEFAVAELYQEFDHYHETCILQAKEFEAKFEKEERERYQEEQRLAKQKKNMKPQRRAAPNFDKVDYTPQPSNTFILDLTKK